MDCITVRSIILKIPKISHGTISGAVIFIATVIICGPPVSPRSSTCSVISDQSERNRIWRSMRRTIWATSATRTLTLIWSRERAVGSSSPSALLRCNRVELSHDGKILVCVESRLDYSSASECIVVIIEVGKWVCLKVCSRGFRRGFGVGYVSRFRTL